MTILVTMQEASISQLKARLSQYMRLVRGGQEVIVTDRGVPVARIVALDSERRLDARVKDLVERGLVRPPASGLPKDFWKRPRPIDAEGRVVDALLGERSEGR